MQQKYSAPDNTEILGATILAVTQNIRSNDFKDLIEEYGYTNVDPKKWYNLQHLLNFYKDLAQRKNNTENLVAIGIRVYRHIQLPPEIDTLLKALHMLNDIQHLNLRNYPNDWDNIIEVIKAGHIRITERGPFPHDLLYGYFFGICGQLLLSDTSFRIKQSYTNPDNPDMAGATYDITWT